MQAVIEPLSSAAEPKSICLSDDREFIPEIRAALARRIGEIRLAQWFGPQTQLEISDGRLMVLALSPFVAQWIRGHFIDDLRHAAYAVARITDVDIHAGSRHAGAPPRSPAAAADAASSRGVVPPTAGRSPLDRLNPLFTLDRFIAGGGNRMALHAARLAAADQEKMHGPLFIHGNCGLGKTHLLQGICRAYAEKFPLRRWHYLTAEQFTNEFLDNIKKSTMPAFRRRMRRNDLLIVDDCHFLSRKASTQQEFLHTFNEISAAGGKIVLAADCAPADIPDLNDALASRLVSGMVVRVDPPDTPTKAAILRQAAQSRGWNVSDVIINRLSRESVAGVRELEGRLTQMLMRQTMAGSSAVEPSPLPDTKSDELPPQAPVALILKVTADHLGQSVEKLTGGCRSADCARARGIAMYLLRELAHRSFPEIGRIVGVKSHSAVIAACRRVSEQVGTSRVLLWRLGGELRSASVTQIVADITARIRQSPRPSPSARGVSQPPGDIQ